MKKRVLSFAIAVCMIFGCAAVLPEGVIDDFVSTFASAQEETDVSEKHDFVDIDYKLYGFHGDDHWKQFNYTYNDDMFNVNSNELSTDLAKLSVGLATAAYNKNEIIGCLSSKEYNMGFTIDKKSLESYDNEAVYTSKKKDYDVVAYSIAYKTATFNGKKYNIVLVPIRGTHGNPEWFSDFNLGSGPNHAGFYAAAGKVDKALSSFFKSKGFKKDNTIILTTGHSRGAAVANILAGEYFSKYANTEHIFAYTFACPSVSKNANTDLHNIYNYNNCGDVIPALPLEDKNWGYKRYGQTIVLEAGGVEYENFLQQFKRVVTTDGYEGMTSATPWVETFKTIAKNPTEYNKPDTHLLFDIVAAVMGQSKEFKDNHTEFGAIWAQLDVVLQDYATHGGSIGVVVALKLVFYYAISHPVTSAKAVASALVTAYKLIKNSPSLIDSYASKLSGEIQDLIDLTDKKKANTNEKFKNLILDANKSKIKEIKEITIPYLKKYYNITDITSRQHLVYAKKGVDSILTERKDFSSKFEAIVHLFFVSNNDPKNPNSSIFSAIKHGHTGETYILWINSLYCGTDGWTASTVAPESISSEITTIGLGCFQDNNQIKTLDIPNGVEHIRPRGFCNCKELTRLVIPSSMLDMGKDAFGWCAKLNSVTLPCDLSTSDCFKYSTKKDGTFDCNIKTIHYTFRNEGKMLDENSSVALHGTDRTLTSVILDEGITHIGKKCFDGRYALTSVNLPSTLKTIDKSAFQSCTALKHIELPNNFEKLGDYCFAGCEALQEITIPKKVTVIPPNCFSGCKGLTSLVIPNTVTELGKDAFQNCTGIKTITLPCDLHTSNCFGGSKVEMIHFTYGQTGKIIDKESWSLMSDAQHTISSIILDDGITHIGKSCFYGLRNLTSVKLPSNIKEIGLRAFQLCDNLEYISIPNSISFVDIGAFHNCNKLNTVVYNGTEEDWGKITIKEENEPLEKEKVTISGKHCVHNYKAVVTTPATCTTDGIITYTCTKCNDSYSETAPSAHKMGDWIVTTKPTCTTVGVEERSCKTCGEKETRCVKELSHNFGNWDIKYHNSVTGKSTLERKCKNCSHKETKKEENVVQRLAGSNRYATAAAISKKSFKTSDTVVLAYGSNSADALAGVTLAAHYNAPILLTDTKKLPADTLNEIKRLKTKKVIILGGEGAIGTDVESVLNKNNITTQRIAGKTRFGTATAIAEELTNNPKEIFFVYAYNFADALSASTVAAVKGAPIIYLKTTGDIDADTAAYLAKVKGKVTKAYVIGSTGVISDNMKNKAGKALGLSSVTRVAGADRYATCVGVNEKFKDVLTGNGICVAKGLDFPDALAGGVFAALNKMPLFLADGSLKDVQDQYLGNKDISNIYIFGGTGAVPNGCVEEIAKAS